eukprot:g3693.t1
MEQESELTFPKDTISKDTALRFSKAESFREISFDAKGGTAKKEGKVGAEVKDPCAPVKDKKSGKSGVEILPKGCDPPPGVCPGEENPKKKGEYLVNGKFVKPKKDEIIQPCSGHGKAMRNGAKCDWMCESGWGGGTPKNCSLRWREALVVDILCADMPDPYFMICHNVMHTICKPYSLSWRFECQRTCQAIVGKSCLKEKIVQHCSHDPECPYMCFKMMDENCKAQEAKLLRLVPGLDPTQAAKGAEEKKSSSPAVADSDKDGESCSKVINEEECVDEKCEWEEGTCHLKD